MAWTSRRGLISARRRACALAKVIGRSSTLARPMKLASQDGFAQDGGLVWRWYMERLKRLGEVQPNPAHLAIARLQKQKRDVTLITQNVDDLHERAGSQAVLHLHGTIARFHCNECGAAHLISAVEMNADQPPVCDLCLGRIRPSVVWFGEMLPQHELQQAWQARKYLACPTCQTAW